MFKKSLLIMLLVACMAPWAAGQDTYTKITSISDLVSGEQYLLVNEANKKVTLTTGATTSSANYLSTATVSDMDTENHQVVSTSLPENAAILTITGSSTYTLKNQNDKYICGTYSSSNCRLYWGTNDGHYSWNITFDASGNVTIKRTIGSNINYIAYSYGSMVGNTSNTTSIALYKKQSAPSCPAPTDVVASNLSQNSATLSWNVTGEHTNFQYVLSTTSLDATALAGATPVDVNNATSVTFNETLTENTDYYFYVRTNCGSSEYSDWSEELHFKTLGQYPIPTGLTATVTALTASISWTAPTATTGNTLTGYGARYKLGEGEWIDATDNISETTCSLTGLTANTEYTFQVKAIYTDGESVTHDSDWAETTFTTATPSVTVSPVTAKLMEGGTIVLTATLENNEGAIVNWTSANMDIATLEPATGSTTTVTGVAEGGPVNITATITVGGVDYTSTCAVTVANDILMSNGSISTCSGHFYDSGGSTANYSNNEEYTFTIYPGTTGNMVKVDFTSFTVEDYGGKYDYLIVYDGTSTSSTQIGKYYGSTSNIPTTCTATNSDGALTFYFKSDGSSPYAGWEATISCVAPAVYEFTEPTEVTPNSAIVNWNGGYADFIVQYKKHADIDWTTVVGAVSTRSCELTGLDAETAYDVKVTDNSSDVISQENYFTTGVTPVTITSVTGITHNSATLNWTGGKANYTVQYKKNSDADWTTFSSSVSTTSCTINTLTAGTTYDVKVSDSQATSSYDEKTSYFTTALYVDSSNPFSEGFTDATFPPAGWSNITAYVSSATRQWTSNTTYSSPYAPEYDGPRAYSGYYGDVYLVMPNIEIASDAAYAQLSFYSYTTYRTNYVKSSVVLLDDDDAVITELWNDVDHKDSWNKYGINLTAYNGQTIKIAFKYEGSNDHGWFIDDVTVKVYDKVFNGDGEDWDYLTNWTPNGLPQATDKVFINSVCTIDGNVVATADEIDLGSAGSITIADGGQLICNNNPVITANKTTSAWNTTDKGWYLISSPVNNIEIEDFVTDNDHNVYSYIEKSRYWNEYRGEVNTTLGTAPFTKLDNGRGYLYRSEAANLAFSGNTNVGPVEYTLSYTATEDDMDGFNLIGNPYPHNIYKGVAIPAAQLVEKYAVLNTDGTWTLTNDNVAIAPMQAVLVQATSAGNIEIADNAAAPVGKYANDNIWFTVKNNEFTDVACVEFKEGHGFNKPEHRNENAPMLYIMNNGEKFASANMPDNTSVINLGFEAKTMGEYTISLKAEGQYSYMHLIDKLTGEDIDMLVEDSYTFIGSQNDRKDRFVLNLNYNAAGIDSESDIFAYQSGSDIIVSGEGELQVFDITGRKVMTTNINGVETINGMNTGVYIFRMNGKAQKIVIR